MIGFCISVYLKDLVGCRNTLNMIWMFVNCGKMVCVWGFVDFRAFSHAVLWWYLQQLQLQCCCLPTPQNTVILTVVIFEPPSFIPHNTKPSDNLSCVSWVPDHHNLWWFVCNFAYLSRCEGLISKGHVLVFIMLNNTCQQGEKLVQSWGALTEEVDCDGW